MGVLEVLWCAFVGHILLVPLTEAAFIPSILPFPYEMASDFNAILNPWSARLPGFGTSADISSVMKAVQVYCDERDLILLVNKRLADVTLHRDEIQLGDGCYSNSELPSQLMFMYGYDQCGTSHDVENGLDVFSNFLHFSPRKVLNTRLTPSTVHFSCLPDRLKEPKLPYHPLAEKSRRFSIQAMDPSWTSAAESNVYMRGQIINVQVSAKIGPQQQLFIQSCFISASPAFHTKPRHAIIMNKGCTAPFGSPYTVKFLNSDNSEVKFALNSTYLISELYIHCSVLITDIGITSGSKSCNYDVVHSRWEDLSGNVKVCHCCNAKCKGLSVKHLSEDANALVSTGPLIMVQRPAPTIPKPAFNDMQSDAAAPEDESVIDTSLSSEFQWPTPLSAVVVVKQDPVSSLTLVLPAQNEQSDTVNDEALNELQIPILKLKTNLNDTKGQSADLAPDRPLHIEVRDELRGDEKAVESQDRTNSAQPIRHSKIQLSKSADGSQTLSYEEAVVAQDGGAFRSLGVDEPGCKHRRARRGLRSTFLDLLRKMDKKE
ncbi:zona pellucida protein C [Hippocampus zosterae]|uniref:zona pellucida protein C n=1 Tax=Hippocampus zosterae TaxID=109293 RepID=UPI00223D57F8|nr:zona pellucida protein C [Hippocampus zosterae]